mgnify:CR=1 FL=1
MTYTISYKNPEIEAATVIITDSIPEGLDYVDDSAGEYASYNAETRMLTWKIADVQPGADGTVTFDARVNESAETVVENKATIQIGENGPEYETDTDRKEIPKDGNLSISKTIVLTEGQGTGIDKEKEFTFIVALKDAKGTALTKEYAYAVTGESGEEIKKGNAADGTEISFQHGQKAVITGLPAGAQYTVTEKEVDGYTTTVNGNAGNAASGTITSNTTAEANFTNTYSVAGSLSGSEALKVTKELTGRKWLDTDTFSYTLTQRMKRQWKPLRMDLSRFRKMQADLRLQKHLQDIRRHLEISNYDRRNVQVQCYGAAKRYRRYYGRSGSGKNCGCESDRQEKTERSKQPLSKARVRI